MTDYFFGRHSVDLDEAFARAREEHRPVFMVIYDSKRPSQSKLQYSLGYFMEYDTTKQLVQANFVQALLDVHAAGVRQYVPADDPLENCLLVLAAPTGKILRQETVYANPDEAMIRVREMVQMWQDTMTYEPIQELVIENFRCIRKVSFALSPLHALIGPNDSGKSTVLLALRTAAQFAVGDFGYEPNTKMGLGELFSEKSGTSIALRYKDELGYRIQKDEKGVFEVISERGKALAMGSDFRGWNMPGSPGTPNRPPQAVEVHFATIRDRLTRATMVRFDPDFLRAPAQLIPDTQGIAFADERGTGLAGVFDAIINRDSESFARIQEGVRRLFPSVDKVGLINASITHKEMAVTLTNGSRIGAKSMSEGLLYYLGFAALQHIEGSRILLIEEPENGLHPARISEIMSVLREISKTSQVVIATHSPLVANELAGHEISVVTRDATEGTRAKLLKDVPRFDEASKVYQPGEFWLSYSDGNTEEPLLTGTPRP
jgi:predicted ATPase